MQNQLTFEHIRIKQRIEEIKEQAAELDRLCKEIARTIKREDFARDTDKSYSYISEILNTNGEQKKFQLDMIPALTISPEFYRLINFLCDIANPQREYPKIKPLMTLEEELRRIKRIIEQCNLQSVFEKEGINFG